MFGKQKVWKDSKQFKPSNVITYNIYNICNSYKQIELQFLFVIYLKIMENFHQQKLSRNTSRNQKMRILRKQKLNGHKRQTTSPPPLKKNIEILAFDAWDSIQYPVFAEINKKYGRGYEPSSLAAIHSSIDRYLC